MIDQTHFVAPGDSLDHYYIAMRGGLAYDVRTGNTVIVANALVVVVRSSRPPSISSRSVVFLDCFTLVPYLPHSHRGIMWGDQ